MGCNETAVTTEQSTYWSPFEILLDWNSSPVSFVPVPSGPSGGTSLEDDLALNIVYRSDHLLSVRYLLKYMWWGTNCEARVMSTCLGKEVVANGNQLDSPEAFAVTRQ